MKYEAIVIGVSAGGMNALKILLSALPKGFSIPIVVVQHLDVHSHNYFAMHLSRYCNLEVKEIDEKEPIEKGYIYVSPPNYHSLIEKDKTFTLTVEERVSYARPSIDLLFETAADAFEEGLIGIILTGANHDGSYGVKKIKENGGIVIVQDPETAEFDAMPRYAIKSTKVDYLLNLEDISKLLLNLETNV